MDGELTGPTPALVGRERELRLLAGLAASASGGGGGVVLAGEPGIGRTSLLRRVAHEWTGGRTVWVRGSEAETGLPYAGLADLLVPLQPYFEQLPDVQREALETSLALRSGPPVGPLAVCAAALGVLSAAGAESPVLLLVDDLQWVDPASQQVLLFVARRLGAERVLMVCAVCDRPSPPELPPDLPVLRVGGLEVAACRALVAARGIDVCEHVLDRLVRRCGGNPTVLLESLATRPAGARCHVGPADVTLGANLHRAWNRVLAALPEPTRVALYVLAAGQQEAPAALEPVLAGLGRSLADLAPAEQADLISVREGVPGLAHPLLRSAVAAGTPLGVRVAVHRALAEHVRGPDRAWHLAAAATGPDEPVAGQLAAAAAAARGRGAHRTSALVLGQAAALTPDPAVRAQRLLAAATDALAAGQAELAHTRCEQAAALRPGPEPSAGIAIVTGRALTWMGHPARAAEALARAAAAAAPAQAAALHAEVAWPALLANRIPLLLGSAGSAARLAAEDADGEAAIAVLAASSAAQALSGRPAAARERLAAATLLDAADSPGPTGHGDHLVLLARTRIWVEDRAGALTALDSAVDQARRHCPYALAGALTARCEVGWWSGQWAAATADGVEALRWAEELGQVAGVALATVALARLDASRGDTAACGQRLSGLIGDTGPYGIGCTAVHRPAVLGLAALGAGDPGEAAELLEAAWDAAVEGGLTAAAGAVPFAADLLEAHLRAGHGGRVAQLLAWLDEQADSGLGFPAAVAARCRGLLAADAESAARHFADAVRWHRRVHEPFELARTLLCEGEALRRLRRPAAARPVLRAALHTFDALGARPWADRAASELAASGQHRSPRPAAGGPDLDALTPQEMQIARVVADGLNNVEAGALLYLSRKTVEAHLTRVYRKLGLRSRTDLARVLGSTPGAVGLPDPAPTGAVGATG